MIDIILATALLLVAGSLGVALAVSLPWWVSMGLGSAALWLLSRMLRPAPQDDKEAES